ncbi:PTS sugar transporter subunit IIC [Lacticaseibacillus baoqingensis]|uniref:PTS sugar transporter subunit IIC n=1 Tax=Lacticaseibacillus baoqingensis TaxID=2486013 RepID=A0ABW4EA04_9LACO|nr:PTS sugar transporter subunit IIC [Lacticaseibacillus baoqingensis]
MRPRSLSPFEPLTQIDIIAANPIPIFGVNLVAGAVNGIIVTLFGLVINVTGMATPWAGLIVAFGFNDPMKVIMAVLLILVASTIFGYLGAIVFKNFPIHTVQELHADEAKEDAKNATDTQEGATDLAH